MSAVTDSSPPLPTQKPRKRTGFGQSLMADLRKTWHLYLFLLPTFTFILLFRYYPAGSAIYHSFTKWNGAGIATWVGLSHFQDMLSDVVLIASFKNIAIILVAALIKVLIFPLAAAELIFNLKNERAQYWFRLLLIIPLVVPGIVNTLVWRFIMGPRPFGVLNTILESVGLEQFQHAWLAEPKIALYSVLFVGFPWVEAIAMLIYYAGLQNITSSIIDASKIDGATTRRRIFSIDLPLIFGQIKLLIVITTIFTLQNFGGMLVLTNGGPGFATMVPGLWMYQRAFQADRFGYASAIGVILLIMMLILTYINNRYIRSSDIEYEE
ncbi:sugar ABC transporter permease [Chloroflexi bacterium TSY]|nr:sugar ABC transporter permease [Chloroflexi bacterium TSY]